MCGSEDGAGRERPQFGQHGSSGVDVSRVVVVGGGSVIVMVFDMALRPVGGVCWMMCRVSTKSVS